LIPNIERVIKEEPKQQEIKVEEPKTEETTIIKDLQGAV